MVSNRFWLHPLLAASLLAGCATQEKRTDPRRNPELVAAEQSLKKARSLRLTPEVRAGYYLDAAARADSILTSRLHAKQPARHAIAVYNDASAELTTLLREHDTLWCPVSCIPAPGGDTFYQLRLQDKDSRAKGVYSPHLFTDFKPASKIKRRGLRTDIREPGFGGTLVGIRKTGLERTAQDPFAYRVGRSAPVTATLDFRKASPAAKIRQVTLTLNDPSRRTTAPISGERRPLAGDFTAPLAWYPRRSEFWSGLMSMIKVEEHLKETGLYMLAPYDPERIPVILVHGLASTPQMWLNVVNEIEDDPVLRGRFQYWVYWYPTGNPLAYSAYLFREDLKSVEKAYGLPKGCIVISHSMGGLVGKMQSTTTERKLWNAVLKQNADRLYDTIKPEVILKRSLIFEANPAIKRHVFICVPHQGSELAIGTLGELASRLISLPGSLVQGLKTTLGTSFDILTGGKGGRYLTSIQSLSPGNPVLAPLTILPINVPYHSIIGDRGKGNSPNSSDGVVPYWSAHLPGAQSELIVPGPHGSFELPQTVDELQRILSLHIAPSPRVRKTK